MNVACRMTNCFKLSKFQQFCCIFIFYILHSSFYIPEIFAQTPSQFKQIKDKEGLLGNVINCFLQDRDGFLWIGTYDGLKRYSGGHTNVFRPNRRDSTSICNNVIHEMCEDQTGRIWFSTDAGIAFYDKQKNSFTNFTTYQNTPLNGCFNILLGMDGNIWFSSYWQGFFKYDVKTNKIEKIGQPKKNGIVQNGLVEDKLNQGIWIGTNEGMYFYDYPTKTLQNYLNNPHKFEILTTNESVALTIHQNQLIFADNNKSEIIFFDLKEKKITKTFKPESKIKQSYFDAATIFVDKYHHLWVSTWNYIVFYIEPENNKIVQLFHDKTKPSSIANDFFWAAWEQTDGSIWLGTTNGISIHNPDRNFYKVYDISELFPALDEEFGVGTFIEDATDGSWWLGTSLRGLIHYFPQKNTLKIYKLPNKTAILPYGGIVANLREFENQLYFLSGNALFQFNKKSQAFKQLNTKPVVRGLTLQNDKAWVIIADKKIASYHIPTGVWKEYDLENLFIDKQHELGSPFVDSFGRFGLISDREGIFYYDSAKDKFEPLRAKKPVEFSTFYSMVLPDKLGHLWIYGKDIVKINLKTQEATTVFETERAGNAIIDNHQNHWLGLYNRYQIFNPKTGQTQQFDLPFNAENAKYYTKLFKLRNGNILTAQKSNLIEFSPEKINLKSPIGKILLDKISLADSSFLLHGDSAHVRLKHDKNTFTITHGIIDQYDETKYQYYYQLKGYSDDWIATDVNSTTFTNLDGGDYIYSLKAVRSDGVSTAVRTLFIDLDTIFYKTAWFKVLFVLFSMMIIFLLFRYRSNQRKKIHHLQLQSTRLEKDKSDIQYQNLINHLNPHFLFNSLTSLNSLIMTEPKTASKFLQKLSAIYRYILQSKDKEVVSLDQELSFVKNYIELQKSRFDEGIDFRIDVSEEYLASGIVPVTLQNLFENAIKHNTIEEDKPLIISIFVEDECLIVKNNLQKKQFVETSNKQGLDSLKKLYQYLSSRPLETIETENEFIVKVPLI